jgi:hypothetical protein
MTETLLSPSNILLFGRKVEDLDIIPPLRTLAAPRRIKPVRVRAASTPAGGNVTLNAPQTVDTITLNAKDLVLVKDQTNPVENGVYIVKAGAWDRHESLDQNSNLSEDLFVRVKKGAANSRTTWALTTADLEVGVDNIVFAALPDDARQADGRHGPFTEDRAGVIGELEQQLIIASACFARIYGFSFEGTYYELPRPVLFLVHGDGIEATEARNRVRGIVNRARGLGDPSLTGIAAADFQFAEDLRVWSYDKADYTIRMDVETGMFEQVLLDIFFGGGGPGVSGARVSGARVSGARVSGARVSGARLSGGSGD